MYVTKNWLFWAGVSFIVGGFVSLGLTLGASPSPSFSEDLTGYAVGWIFVGMILIVIGYIKKKNVTSK